MKPIVYDATLSATILNASARILPYTAEGKTMPADKARDVVVELALALRLAAAMEQELAVHRLGEAGMLARASLEGAATTALDQLIRDPVGKVVKVDFDKGRKS
ncbi:hypothetical protein KYK30_20415 [Shinella yambaruensis]|uniref:Uncharacterized protein n=1 Tax=Shinella yambaruensis TaxID=415996 RepID=A0ABQ5ZI04_9HYPH|nr:hypothetical protein [Shinella yambaruensis]MCJ8027042.1 hypothetical protein [Shinella yambaruensis]MCU7982067.1 hypothetical protein [Shinella yambaruensis]GLR51241.1 hypothetical protein GCM10007923_24490 [Shinella yambaruensis]